MEAQEIHEFFGLMWVVQKKICVQKMLFDLHWSTNMLTLFDIF